MSLPAAPVGMRLHWLKPSQAFLLELRVERGLSPLTIAAYRRDLASSPAASTAGNWRGDPAPARRFLAGLRTAGSRGSTLARKTAAIRSFYAFALREGEATRDVATLLETPRAGSYLPDVLARDQVEAVLEAPTDDDIGLRDGAILELLYASGLRVSELVGLNVDRLDLANLQLRVIGKGNKERRVPMGEPARDRLHRYISGPRERWTAGRPNEAVFVSRHGRRLGREAVWRHRAPMDRGFRGTGSGLPRTPSGTALRRICSREEPICAWSRRCWAMLASAPPSSTRI